MDNVRGVMYNKEMFNFLYQVKKQGSNITYLFFLKEEVGSVVFTKGKSSYSIQYHIKKAYREQGMGRDMVKQALAMLSREVQGSVIVEATVIPSNDASISILKSLKFNQVDQSEDCLVFRLKK